MTLIERARRIPFRDRLAIASAGAVAIAVLMASVLVYVAVRGELRGQVDQSLSQRATAAGSVRARRTYLLPPAPALGGPGGFAQYVTHKGEILLAPDSGEPIPVSRAAMTVAESGQGPAFESRYVNGTHVRVITVPVARGVALQIARPLDELDSILARMRLILLLVGIGGIALAASLGMTVARTALRPVNRLTRAAEQVAETRDPSRSIAVSGDDELGRLAVSFNTMLAALDDSLRAQRQLVADASHELRTPLTSLRTNIEVLSRTTDLPADDRARLVTDVIAQIDDLTTLVGDLVDLTRGDEPGQTEQVDLAEITERELARARANFPGIPFTLDAESTMITGIPVRVSRAISNLLDNAGKWSTAGGAVSVTVRAQEVAVRDHGPGIPEEHLPYIFDRFYRAPEARPLPGSGLGLAIVRQTMDAHGGSVSARNAREGGAIFTLRFASSDARAELA